MRERRFICMERPAACRSRGVGGTGQGFAAAGEGATPMFGGKQQTPPAPKAQGFPVQGVLGFSSASRQNHQSSIVILVMTGICLGLFQVSGP